MDLPEYLIPSAQREKVAKIDMGVVSEVCQRIGEEAVVYVFVCFGLFTYL